LPRWSEAVESDFLFSRGARAWFAFSCDFVLVRTAHGDSELFGNVPRADARALLGAVRLAVDAVGLHAAPVIAQIEKPSQGQAVGSAWVSDAGAVSGGVGHGGSSADGAASASGVGNTVLSTTGGVARSFKTSLYTTESSFAHSVGTLSGLAQFFVGKISSAGDLFSGGLGVPPSAYAAARAQDTRGLLKSIDGDASAALRWRVYVPAVDSPTGWDVDILALWPGRVGRSNSVEALLPPDVRAGELHPDNILDAPFVALRAAPRDSAVSLRSSLLVRSSNVAMNVFEHLSARWLISALSQSLSIMKNTCPRTREIPYTALDERDLLERSLCHDFTDATVIAMGSSEDVNTDESFLLPASSFAASFAPPALPIATTVALLTAAARASQRIEKQRGLRALGAHAGETETNERLIGVSNSSLSLFFLGDETLNEWSALGAAGGKVSAHEVGVSPSAAAGTAGGSDSAVHPMIPRWLQYLSASVLRPEDITDSISTLAATSESDFVEVAVRHCWTVLAGEKPDERNALDDIDETALRVIAASWCVFLRHVREIFERAAVMIPNRQALRAETISANRAREDESVSTALEEKSLCAQRLAIVARAVESLVKAARLAADVSRGAAGREGAALSTVCDEDGEVDDAGFYDAQSASGGSGSGDDENSEDAPPFEEGTDALTDPSPVIVQLSPSLAEDECFDAARNCSRAGLMLGPSPCVRCAPTPALIMSDISAFRAARPTARLREFLRWYCGIGAPAQSRAWHDAWIAARPRSAAAQQQVASPHARGEAALGALEEASMSDVLFEIVGVGARAAVARAEDDDGGSSARFHAASVRDAMFAEDGGVSSVSSEEVVNQETFAVESAAREALAAAARTLARDGKNRALTRALTVSRERNGRGSPTSFADEQDERGVAAGGIELAATSLVLKGAAQLVSAAIDYEGARVRAAALAAALEAACRDSSADFMDGSAGARPATNSISCRLERALADRNAEARALAQCAAAAVWPPPLTAGPGELLGSLGALLDDEPPVLAGTPGVYDDRGNAAPWATVRGSSAVAALMRLLCRARPDAPVNDLLPTPTVSAFALTSDAVREFWPQPSVVPRNDSRIALAPSAHSVVAVTSASTLRIALALSEFE
jgi:hypothetical protein